MMAKIIIEGKLSYNGTIKGLLHTIFRVSEKGFINVAYYPIAGNWGMITVTIPIVDIRIESYE